jgi:hypothetical protein
MSDEGKDLRKLELKEARKLLHEKYGFSMDYLESIQLWPCRNLVR